MSTQLYTPPKSLEQHELRLQTIHFQRSSPSAPNRRWYHTDSQVILPTWTPNSLWPSPLSQQGIPLSPPTHHSPITSIRIAQDLIMSPSGSSFLLQPLLHSVYFLGTLPDQVHSAILDVTITASIGRVVALCRDGNARIWQLEPWLPVPGTIVGGVASEAVAPAAIESGPVVDYDEDMPEGHYHQGIAGKWLTVDDQNDGTGQSAWEHKRVRTDALVAEIPVLQGRTVGEHVERAWVHVARDRLVSGAAFDALLTTLYMKLSLISH
ncbi:hypothetical protein BCR44DRAFT_1496207 [Catenaria anguillulae PL171]|uniref:Uncharacterized protein n=1 Tax=Catenaria anguillulae PL171 TaxID=765915 RepID=A0A1Y2HZG9_9FUNG|nr:hypothetical protein BCR44DRAFT_1496207 [Catenaria anguillulae PL171]